MFPQPGASHPRVARPEAPFPALPALLPSLALLTALLVSVTIGGCVSTGESTRSGGGSANHIEFEEIQQIEASNAYQVVQRLRPGWLRSRGVMSINNPEPSTPMIYVDQVRRGQVNALRQIEAGSLQELRYLNAGDATTRFGTGHAGGAILVSIRR